MSTAKTPPVEEKNSYAQVHTPGGTLQRGPFKRKRAGIELTKEEVRAIKAGRKKLRKELRAAGIKSKKEFELTASSLMLYFDKHPLLGFLPWLFHGRGLWFLIGATAALLLAGALMSTVMEMRGHFTINLSDGMFKEGFSLSETIGFENPTMRLFAEPAVDVPAFSISDIKEDADLIDGQHNEDQYFAYTFYVRNEGDNTVDYTWELCLNAESKDLSSALWVMVFEDGQMKFYAEARADGTPEALPGVEDNTRGYLEAPMSDFAVRPDQQYQLIEGTEDNPRYRVIPYNFQSEDVITSDTRLKVKPMEVHKYTVVIWLEGDDPDCTNALIGGHAGVDMQFRLVGEKD